MARAYREYADAVTGQRFAGPKHGAVATGRLVVRKRVDGKTVLVPVDRELVNQADPAYSIDPEAKPEIQRDAKRIRKQIEPSQRKRVRGYRSTFRSGRQGAREFVAANPTFFHNVAASDPYDAIADWMQRQRIKVGRAVQPMHKSKRGQKILQVARSNPQQAVTEILGLLFGAGRNRSWERVDWREVRSFLDELEAHVRRSGMESVMVGEEALVYPPEAGEELTRQDLDQYPAAVRSRVRGRAERDRLREVETELRAARRAARKCLPQDERKVVNRRIRRIQWLLDRPQLIADSGACGEGDRPVCSYGSLLEEAKRISRACEQGYDADWPVAEAERAVREGGTDDQRLADYPDPVVEQAIERVPPASRKRKVLRGANRSVLRDALRRDQ